MVLPRGSTPCPDGQRQGVVPTGPFSGRNVGMRKQLNNAYKGY